MSTDPNFRMTVQDVFSIRGRGTVVTGRIESGEISVGDEINIQHGGATKKVKIAGIEAFRKTLPRAQAGDNVGLLLKDVTKDDVQQGDVLAADYAGPDFTWKP
jgi:elongation factor Tu